MSRLQANERKFPKRKKELPGTKTKAAKLTSASLDEFSSASISSIVALIEYEKENTKN